MIIGRKLNGSKFRHYIPSVLTNLGNIGFMINIDYIQTDNMLVNWFS